MKKYYMKPIIIFSSMIIMVITLNHLSKDKLILETTEGQLSNIGDVSLVYTPAITDLKREEIVISSDGIKNYSKKGFVIGRDFIEIDNENNDFVKSIPSKNIFEDENYIGKLRISQGLQEYEDITNEIIIDLKSKKNQNIKTYYIPIENQDVQGLYSDLIYCMTLYNENIYVVGADNQSVYIAKIDLNKKSYELMTRINDFTYNVRDLITFRYKDRIYIEVNYQNSDFLIYDINNNKLIENKYYEENKLNHGGFADQEVLDINLKDNKLSIISKNGNNEVSKYEYIIHEDGIKSNELKIYDYKIEFDYIYNEYNGYYENEEGMKNIQVVDDKIYTLHQRVKYTSSKTKDGAVPLMSGNKPIEFSVFDMKENRLVYKSNIITSEEWIEHKFHFVNNY